MKCGIPRWFDHVTWIIATLLLLAVPGSRAEEPKSVVRLATSTNAPDTDNTSGASNTGRTTDTSSASYAACTSSTSRASNTVRTRSASNAGSDADSSIASNAGSAACTSDASNTRRTRSASNAGSDADSSIASNAGSTACTSDASNDGSKSNTTSAKDASGASNANNTPAPSAAAKDPSTGKPRFEYVEDGLPTQKLQIPVYEWIPPDHKPSCLVLAIHGLTLHGGRFELLGKVSASGGYYFVAPDMRGYGKCRVDKTGKYKTGTDSRNKIDYEKSAEDLALLARFMKEQYPGIPLLLVGESLGATMVLKLAAAHPELADGLVLSSPAAKVHPLMYVYPDNIAEGILGVIRPSGEVKLNAFMKKLVSANPRVGQELLKDPLVAKELTIGELLVSESFVHKTLKYAREVKEGTPVLILAASKDHCVRPDAVTKITENIRSANQTIRWLDHLDHLLLESDYIRAATVDSLTDWSDDQSADRQKELAEIHKLMEELGDKATD